MEEVHKLFCVRPLRTPPEPENRKAFSLQNIEKRNPAAFGRRGIRTEYSFYIILISRQMSSSELPS